MRQMGEPSVEEILESIKKVIARDNRAGAATERRQREERGLEQPHSQAEIAQDDEVLDLGGYIDDEEPAEIGGDAEEQSALLQPAAASSISESLAALAMLSQPGVAPQIVRSGETSLEGMVRELLRPALAEWLDKNLPPLVERMVAVEIARIVGKKG